MSSFVSFTGEIYSIVVYALTGPKLLNPVVS